MTEIHFGDIIGMDYIPSLRLMALGPTDLVTERQNWWGTVLADDQSGWRCGDAITFSPENKGIRIIEAGL